MKNKSIVLIMVLCMITGCLCGCGSKSSADMERWHPKKLAKQEAADIFEYIKNEDTKSLVALFSDDVKNTHNLDREWKEFFEKIDGKVVSYDSISFPGEGMGVDKDGNIYDSHLSINYNNVKTDTGAVYKQFGYYQTRIDTKKPNRQGINLFTVQLPDKTFYTVGDYIE